MLKHLMNEKLKNEVNTFIEVCDYFIEPELSFLLTKETKNGRNIIFGVYDKTTGEKFVVIDNNGVVKILGHDEIKYSKKQLDYYGPRIECYILNMIDKGYQLIYMDILLHAYIWDFIDEFIYEVTEMENGLYDYLLFCEQTGIKYETLVFHSNFIIITNALYHFYQVDFRNYGVLLYQPIDNHYLLLGTNYDEEAKRYYAVLLLNARHEIVENKRYDKLQSAVNDFNKRFYDMKIKEHKECEAFIKFSIEEHINFLKERNEEIG